MEGKIFAGKALYNGKINKLIFMRIGFILECSSKGPDADIYPYLAKNFCLQLEVEPKDILTLTNKENVMNDGPASAQTLLEAGCDYVFIIWDRMPKWGGTGKCEDHVATLEEAIAQLQIERAKIFLCCITDMLESWMIVYGQAVTDYFQQFSPKPLPYFGDHKDKASQAEPKSRIKKYNNRYNDYTDNFKIVKMIDDFDMPARWNDSFKFFKESIEEICPN